MNSFLQVTILVFTLFSINSYAQQITAYVDQQFVINNSSMGKEAQLKMEQLAKRTQGEAARMENEISSLKEDIEKNRGNWSNELILQKEAALNSIALNYQQRLLELESQYKLEYDKSLDVVIKVISSTVSEIARTRGYTYVIDKSNLLYVDRGIDITEEVIYRMNN